MNLVLFGSTNPTGAAFLQLTAPGECITYGRNAPVNSSNVHIYCDIGKEVQTDFASIHGVLVSFAPIWLFSEFLQRTAKLSPEKIKGLSGIVACSSSSYVTKRFAFCREDQLLAKRLSNSHFLLESICSELGIGLQILAPTLVYGCVNGYRDKNISKLIRLMRKSPILMLPANTGMRQPIHASQLAMAALVKAQKMLGKNCECDAQIVECLGGDQILSYHDMLTRIKEVLPAEDPANNCGIYTVPDRLFYTFSAPLLPLNPKMFEAIVRMKSDLSGFKKVHQITGQSPQEFPVIPIPI